MKIKKEFQPELAVSKDIARDYITCCYLDKKEKAVFATNGHYLIRIPAEVEASDVSGPLSVDVIKTARKFKPADKLEIELSETREALPNGLSMPRKKATSPPFTQIDPGTMPKDPGTVTIAVTAKYLADIVKALGGKADDEVALTFPVPAAGKELLDPILVVLNKPEDPETTRAILMPCALRLKG